MTGSPEPEWKVVKINIWNLALRTSANQEPMAGSLSVGTSGTFIESGTNTANGAIFREQTDSLHIQF